MRCDAERLLVDINKLGLHLVDQSPHRTAVAINVPVHVAGAAYAQFDNAKSLWRKSRLRPIIPPLARHD